MSGCAFVEIASPSRSTRSPAHGPARPPIAQLSGSKSSIPAETFGCPSHDIGTWTRASENDCTMEVLIIKEDPARTLPSLPPEPTKAPGVPSAAQGSPGEAGLEALPVRGAFCDDARAVETGQIVRRARQLSSCRLIARALPGGLGRGPERDSEAFIQVALPRGRPVPRMRRAISRRFGTNFEGLRTGASLRLRFAQAIISRITYGQDRIRSVPGTYGQDRPSN